MQRTNNYQLPQWEATDALKRADFNEANAAVDSAIKAAADAAATANTASGSASPVLPERPMTARTGKLNGGIIHDVF